MKILIVTDSGESLGFADRLTREGHEVSVYSKKERLKSTGIFEQEDNIYKALQSCNFCICDIDGWDFLDQRASSLNRPVIGSSAMASLPNTDAIKQHSLFKRFELPIPETLILDDVGEAISAALDWNSSRTIIRYGTSKFQCDYRDWLAWAVMRVPVGQKILFQRTALGIKGVITGWFDGLRWLDSFSISPYIDSDLYRYSAVAPLNSNCILVEETIKKLTPYFLKLNYRGPVHLSVIVKNREIVVDELQVGFRFPLDYTILEFFRDDLGRFFNTVAFSNDGGVIKTKDFVFAVQAICNGKDMEGAPIIHLNSERMKHLVLQNVHRDGEDYSVADTGKVIFTATAHGPSPLDTDNRVKETLVGVKFPEKHFNDGLGGHATPFFTMMQNWRHI